MQFKEIKLAKGLRVRDMDAEPFEGVYLEAIEGKHGLNYKFFSENQIFTVYGTKALQEKMSKVEPGYAVRITKLSETETKAGGTYLEIKVEVSDEPVEGFDVAGHLES